MFKVLTLCTSGWDDCWMEWDGTPTRFATEAEAQAEIDELLADWPDYDADDYKVVPADANPAHIAAPMPL